MERGVNLPLVSVCVCVCVCVCVVHAIGLVHAIAGVNGSLTRKIGKFEIAFKSLSVAYHFQTLLWRY